MNEARIWDPLARRYDVIVRAFDRAYPKIRLLLAEDLRGRSRVLEVGAGTGQFTLDLARVAESLIATDISPQMVERLQYRVRARGLENVRVAVMNAYALEIEDNTLDGVFCANALHVMDDPVQALREFRRVLAEDGVLIAPTFLHGADRARRLLSRALGVVSPFVAHSRFNLNELRHIIEKEGLTVMRCERLSGLFPIGYVVASSPHATTGKGDR